MPALSTIAIFLFTGLGILLIPGPAVLYVVTRSAAQGRRAGLASVLGIESATCVHILAVALGLSAILLTSALAFNVVKYLGAAYLILLGLRTLFAKGIEDLLHYPGSRGLIRRFENLSSTRMCNSSEGRPKMLPFSRRWYFGPCPYAVASRSCGHPGHKERRSSDVIE